MGHRSTGTLGTLHVVRNPDLTAASQRFFALHGQFEELCDAWRLFRYNGERNDHSDAGYDAAVLENLAHLHAAAEPTIAVLDDVFHPTAPYGQRLESVLVRIQDGESNMFTGVMCGSYHDVWMELHAELLVTDVPAGDVDRTGGGSS
jgi:hypothetical protein